MQTQVLQLESFPLGAHQLHRTDRRSYGYWKGRRERIWNRAGREGPLLRGRADAEDQTQPDRSAVHGKLREQHARLPVLYHSGIGTAILGQRALRVRRDHGGTGSDS